MPDRGGGSPAGALNRAMVTDEERQIFAMALVAKHGGRTARYVATRLGELAALGDIGGIAFWQDIAARISAIGAQSIH